MLAVRQTVAVALTVSYSLFSTLTHSDKTSLESEKGKKKNKNPNGRELNRTKLQGGEKNKCVSVTLQSVSLLLNLKSSILCTISAPMDFTVLCVIGLSLKITVLRPIEC